MASENRGGSAKRTVLVLGDAAGVKTLKKKLADEGYDVVGTATTASAAEKLFTSKDPQVLVLHLTPARLDEARALPGLLRDRRRAMIAVAPSAAPELVQAACEAGACGYLIDPVDAAALSAQIQVSCTRFDDFTKLFQEKQDLMESLETRKLVERAKAVLMKRAGLSEPEAHRRLQQESQKRRMGIGEIARRIVESDEIIGEA